MTGFWDRRLAKSHKELKSLTNAIQESKEDPKKLRKKIKRISRYYKSTLGELARLDDSIYNVMEQPQGDADGDKGVRERWTERGGWQQQRAPQQQ